MNFASEIKYKLHIYRTTGPMMGNIDKVEYFSTFEDAEDRYFDLFVPELMSYNPTMWELQDGTWDNGTWQRINGY